MVLLEKYTNFFNVQRAATTNKINLVVFTLRYNHSFTRSRKIAGIFFITARSI